MRCEEIQDLIPLSVMGELSGDEMQKLKEHLARCSTCSQELKEAEELHQGLARAFDYARGPRDGPGMVTKVVLRPKVGIRLIWAAAAAILIGLGTYLLLPSRPDRPQLDRPSWQEVNLADGSMVSITSETRYEVESDRRIILHEGKLFARVKQGVKPFEVITPAGTVIAHGTEFFVETRKGEKEMKTVRWLTFVLILSGIVELTNDYGSQTGTRGESLFTQQDSAPKKHVEDLALRFARYYEPVKIDVKPAIPGYRLPLDLSKVKNLKQVAGWLKLKEDEPLLRKNGFVVVPLRGKYTLDDIVDPYRWLKRARIPILVTADTLLHLYHIQFAGSLKEIEERKFYRDIVAISKAMVEVLQNEYKAAKDEELKEATRKALVYFAIGLKALEPETETPEVVSDDVKQHIEWMKKHEGFQHSPLFDYKEDFSQYVPRGHYTKSEILKRYFMGMMWFGRMTFILKGGEPYGPFDEPFLVSEEESARQTLAASLITRLMEELVLPDGRRAKDVWARIYAVTAYYVGLADDLGMQEYRDALVKVAGAALDVTKLLEDDKLWDLRVELARHNPPAIYSGTGGQGAFDPSADEGKLIEALHKSMGFRFMGQRFVPDSYMMGKLVTPTIGPPTNNRTDMFTCVMTPLGPRRCFPRGLDVMALLGSERAKEILKELGDDAYERYDETFEELEEEFSKLSEKDWNRNLYWSWLYCLKPLLAEFGKGYQTFMTTQAWQDRYLTAALASWSQLRHDTILYAKQSYATVAMGLPPPPPPGYVEPVPEFYGRLLSLTRMTLKGLSEMKVLSDKAKKRLKSLENILQKLVTISEKQLKNEELDKSDRYFLAAFADRLEATVSKVKEEHKRYHIEITKLDTKTTLVADVHTDQNSGKVLEEATGYVDLLVAACKLPDGRIFLFAGPVLSYYEFKHPMKDRLTDEKWRKLLGSGDAPDRPEWVDSYLRE